MQMVNSEVVAKSDQFQIPLASFLLLLFFLACFLTKSPLGPTQTKPTTKVKFALSAICWCHIGDTGPFDKKKVASNGLKILGKATRQRKGSKWFFNSGDQNGCSLVFAFKSKLELEEEASALGIKSVVYLRSPGEYRDPSASHFQESASLRKEFQIMKEAKMHLTENPKAPEDKKCWIFWGFYNLWGWPL